MKIRAKGAAVAVVLGASVLSGGVAEAQAQQQQAVGGTPFKWYCEMTGGVYYGGNHVSYCFYRDGTTVACYGGDINECDRFKRRSLAPSTTTAYR